MEKSFRDFFDTLHQILGFDTQAAREEMNAKLEKLVLVRIAEGLLGHMDANGRVRYEEFLRTNSGAPPEKLADFTRTLLSAEQVTRCVKEGAQQAVQTYMTTLLQIATTAQKKQMQGAFAQVINKVDPAVLRAMVEGGKLSTKGA